MSLAQRTFPLVMALLGIVAIRTRAETPEAELNRLIRPYSTQQIVGLDVNETFTFKLKNGAGRVIRVISVQEQRDSVINLLRRAEVRVEIDGQPLDLVCMPYIMPTQTAGLRLQADTTSGWGNISKRVQLSVWDAADPIVDTKRFSFPLRNYRLLSHGTQAYNEPVHLGAGDGDPGGQRFYHDYGFDTAGFEGRDEVVSAIQGKLVRFWPSREDLCSVIVQDSNGLNWEFGHLKSVEPGIVLNVPVAQGQKIGLLGRTGPSGNFAHLHLGTYLSMQDLQADNRDTRLNLYPWLVTAYQAQHPQGLFAVARPHHAALTGENVAFDGSNSLVWGGAKIIEHRWVFPDGAIVRQAKAERAFDKPGAYVVALWVKDDRGAEDVDFCQVKVFSKENTEQAMPHIFMTYAPTQDIRPDRPVTFRFWFQGSGGAPITVAFDDGTQVSDYKSYAELPHSFKQPGIHIVTASCEADGKPIMQKQKVVVVEAPRTDK
jgi:murein DD-endopeptidase MepM/ murein hydrolase activator NlpD